MVTKNSGKTLEVTEWEKVRTSGDYRSFLKNYLAEKSLNFSDFARAAGFARGFPSDVISGRRRLSIQSCFAFEKALKLPAPGRKLFRMLVAFEEPDLFPDLDPQNIRRSIEELRQKPWRRSRRELQSDEEPQVHEVLRSLRSAMVYAACGGPERPAIWSQLQTRTQLPDDVLRAELDHLINAGLVLESRSSDGTAETIYFPQDLHLIIQHDQKTELLKFLFKDSAAEASKRAEVALNSESEFFFTSVFTVHEASMPGLKKALREVILKFVDDSVQADGQRMARLLAALHL